ncbi:hypothetical protein [Litorilituus sediminis]|uniref:Uncharacterized protein n=1 Tax=Litorilituus sediminis TaxID=718192 RepID=A0A4P6P7U8_9GAMM|nr:hypothetical protein [Litorilituus sediminis]QBG35487.1 hypothetical protein EMK97_07035 [Litorilituus sediminis]
MSIEDFDYDEEEEEEWEDKFQISYTTGKPSPMRTRRKKVIPLWQKIEQLKDEAILKRQTELDDYSYYD